ncbi:MAG: helix-turn-helix transcriptional regulator [Acidimicrobiia bacterium]
MPEDSPTGPGPEPQPAAADHGSGPDWRPQLESLGRFIRAQRRIAGLTLRQLADLADVSNAYLSQIERGKHEPSVRVLRQVARGLNVSAETILDQAGLFHDPSPGTSPGTSHGTEAGTAGDTGADRPAAAAAIAADARLTAAQKDALLAVYRSYLAANEALGSDAGA